MFRASIGTDNLRAILDEASDLDVARFLYCQEMAGTYLAVGRFETSLILTMQMYDRVKLRKALGADHDAVVRLFDEQTRLQGSTLGSLITILEQHGIATADIAYLRWLKDKRDYFVHRLFHEHAWPGDLDEDACRFMQRRLLAIQLWLERGERNIRRIFERAGFLDLDCLADGRFLAMNVWIVDCG